MFVVSPKDLLEAGVHFGCRASRWNPKMAPYIFGRRNLIHIIDLKETLRGLIRATTFLQRLATEGKEILFVGTKRQAQGVVRDAAERGGQHYVIERWLGGTLTNFSTIRSRLRRLEELEAIEEEGSLTGLSKKAMASLMREKRKIYRNLNGIRKMDRLPGAVVVVDPRRENNAVKEASKLGIPVIAILDTDCDPDPIDIPIPGNDDSMRSILVLLNKLTEAIMAGSTAHAQWLAEEAKKRAADEAAKAENQAKLEEARKRRRDERERLEQAQRKLKEEQEKEEAKKAGGAEPAQEKTPEPAKAAVAEKAPEAEKAPAAEKAPSDDSAPQDSKPGGEGALPAFAGGAAGSISGPLSIWRAGCGARTTN